MSFTVENNILYLNGNYIDELYDIEDNNLEYFNCTNIVDETDTVEKIRIDSLMSEDFIENIYFSFYFKKDIYCGVGRKNNIVYMKFYFKINLLDWEERLSIKIFLIKFCSLFTKKGYPTNYNEDEGANISIKSTTTMTSNNTFLETFEILDKEFKITYNEVLQENNISTFIQFSPEHLTAGSSILQYFGKLLQDKYPNEKVSVSIKQEGLKVTMLIETPDGKREEIEEYLNKFGMVVTNQMTPKEFASNPIQQLELETKLKAAEMEIGFQKKLLALKDKTYDENLVSLKDEVKYLRDELSALRISNNENIQLLLTSLLKKDELVNSLTSSISKRNINETKQLLMKLKEKDIQGYVSLKQHIDNAIIGGIVNAPSWIQVTVGILSKV